MKCFINPGHKIGLDSGAVNANGTQEAVVAYKIGELVMDYLQAAGVTCSFLQSNSLTGEDEDYDNPSICDTANTSGADIFVSLHCNACGSGQARGTETLVYELSGNSAILADCIQTQIINALDTVDRGLKERTNLAVLKYTTMPAVLVEMAFIDNDEDCALLTNNPDAFARAIARGITDYQQSVGC